MGELLTTGFLPLFRLLQGQTKVTKSKEIYCKKEDTTKNRQFWDEHAKRSLMMFEEAGIKVNYYEE